MESTLGIHRKGFIPGICHTTDREAKKSKGDREVIQRLAAAVKPWPPQGRRWWSEVRVTYKKLEPWCAYVAGDVTRGGGGGKKYRQLLSPLSSHLSQSLSSAELRSSESLGKLS